MVKRGAKPFSGLKTAIALVLVVLLGFAGQATLWWRLTLWRDQRQFVSATRLDAALETFRPSERAGLAKPVTAPELAPEHFVRTQPARCAPLTLLAQRPAVDGESWTGINGDPAQPVTILTVRYPDATTARSELRDKQVALLRCRTVSLTFPPFDQPARTFKVTVEQRWLPLVGNRVSYSLSDETKQYEFYVRRYANTLTWTFADDVSTPKVRHQIVDDLVRRLREVSRE